MFNIIVAILFNAKENSWHPIIFSERPLPGPPEEGKPVRHKSSGHHTAGFKDRAEAVRNVETELAPKIKETYGEPRLTIKRDILWDGEDLPAMVEFFAEDRGELICTMHLMCEPKITEAAAAP